MKEFMFRATAKRQTLELMILLLPHSSEYELIDDKDSKRYSIFRMFGSTLDGSGCYRGLIASFRWKLGGLR